MEYVLRYDCDQYKVEGNPRRNVCRFSYWDGIGFTGALSRCKMVSEEEAKDIRKEHNIASGKSDLISREKAVEEHGTIGWGLKPIKQRNDNSLRYSDRANFGWSGD
jgi:hypothetical protein